MSERKSYWLAASCTSAKDHEAIKSWFGYMCEGMTPYKAEILCDIATDKEKKIRAFMTDAEGGKHQLERTTGRNFSISVKRLVP